MNFIDFIIGLTLVNTLPHFTLGLWKGRILSLFGFSPKANIAYSLLNFTVSLGLFLFTYGVAGLWENGIYTGGLFVAVSYFAVGQVCYVQWHKKHMEKEMAGSQ